MPRPRRAASRMKWLLGAEPMPIVNRRRSPSRSRIAANSCALVAHRAVGEEDDLAKPARRPPWRRVRARAPVASGAAVGADRRDVALGCPHFSATGRLRYGVETVGARWLKRMTLKVSAGVSRLSARVSAALAWSIESAPPSSPSDRARRSPPRGTRTRAADGRWHHHQGGAYTSSPCGSTSSGGRGRRAGQRTPDQLEVTVGAPPPAPPA